MYGIGNFSVCTKNITMSCTYILISPGFHPVEGLGGGTFPPKRKREIKEGKEREKDRKREVVGKGVCSVHYNTHLASIASCNNNNLYGIFDIFIR